MIFSLCFLFGVNRDYIDLGECEGVLFRMKFHWLRLNVPGISHLHGKAFQEVEPVILLRNMTFLR